MTTACRQVTMTMTTARLVSRPTWPGDPIIRSIRRPWNAGWDTAQRVLVDVRLIDYDLITTAEAISAKQTE